MASWVSSTLLLALLPAATTVLAAPYADHPVRTDKRQSSYGSTELFIPFENAGSGGLTFNYVPKIAYKISENDPKTYTSPMDTGSTGIVLGAGGITDYNATDAASYPIGWEFLSSSNVLYSGNWINKTIYFQNVKATATVPILAVTKVVTCHGWKEEMQGNCPESLATNPQSMPTGISYFGVGFGRQSNGMPQGNPDKNALLNIATINGNPVPSDFYAGYTLTPAGMHVGLTSSNTGSFTQIKLNQQTAYSSDPRDWQMVTGCVSVNGSTCLSSNTLMDTGIAQMYLTVNPSVPVVRVDATSVSSGLITHVLAAGQLVTVKYGSGGSYPASYSFVVGDMNNPVQPYQVSTSIATASTTTGFVNTGRHFFKTHNIMFDAVGGYYGIASTSGS